MITVSKDPLGMGGESEMIAGPERGENAIMGMVGESRSGRGCGEDVEGSHGYGRREQDGGRCG